MSPPFKEANARRYSRDRGHVFETDTVAVAVLAVMAALPAEAEMFGPSFQPCGDQVSTPAVVECVQAKTNVAD